MVLSTSELTRTSLTYVLCTLKIFDEYAHGPSPLFPRRPPAQEENNLFSAWKDGLLRLLQLAFPKSWTLCVRFQNYSSTPASITSLNFLHSDPVQVSGRSSPPLACASHHSASLSSIAVTGDPCRTVQLKLLPFLALFSHQLINFWLSSCPFFQNHYSIVRRFHLTNVAFHRSLAHPLALQVPSV